MSVRSPAVAGQFYAGTEKGLLAELDRCIPKDVEAGKAIGIVAPHAGYVYSGGCAGSVYARVVVPDRVVVLSPNHSGRGAEVSVWAEGEWTTPLGRVPVDEEMASAVIEKCPSAVADREAHLKEHSLEVQVPFIQKLNGGARILPVTIGTHDAGTLKSLGTALAGAIKGSGDDVLIVASNDMTHFESAESARRQDEKALERVRAMDPEGLLSTVRRERISMCGAAPVAAMLWAAKELGAGECELVEYTHSGVVSGDHSNVVAYAGMICR